MKDKIDLKKIIQLASYLVLLGASLLLGLLGKPTEMGLAIAAGSIGLAFANIDKIRRFKGAGFEAEMKEQQMEAVVEKETEPAVDERLGFIKVEGYSADENVKKVIKALKNPKYTWRYASGIMKETGLPKNEVDRALNWLVENQLAKKSFGSIGTIWSLTLKGRSIFQNVNDA